MFFRKIRLALEEFISRVSAKIIALIVIAFMMFADYIAMYDLFGKLNLGDYMIIGGQEFPIDLITVLSLMMCVFLEGSPAFLGMSYSNLKDVTIYKENDKIVSRLGAVLSLIVSVAAILLSVILRVMYIYANGGYSAYRLGVYGGGEDTNLEFIAQVLLLLSPILTSLLAFVASWLAFRSNYKKNLERRVEKLHRRYLIAQSEFNTSYYQLDSARMALWSSLSVKEMMPSGTEEAMDAMPSVSSVFRKECYDRIRNKIIENSIISYSTQVNRYEMAIEAALNNYLTRLKEKSISPIQLQDIIIEDLIKEYDKNNDNTDAKLKWNYLLSGEELEKELKDILDNAVVVARFKNTLKPFHMEGDWK